MLLLIANCGLLSSMFCVEATNCVVQSRTIAIKTSPMVIKLTLFSSGVYELVNYHVKPGMIPQFEHRLLQEFTEIDYNPLGLWYSVFGDIHRGRVSVYCSVHSTLIFAVSTAVMYIVIYAVHYNTYLYVLK